MLLGVFLIHDLSEGHFSRWIVIFRLCILHQTVVRKFLTTFFVICRQWKESGGGGGGSGVLLGILGGGVLPGSPNPNPISNQKMSQLAYLSFFLTHLELKRYIRSLTPEFPRKLYPIPDRNGQNLHPFSDQKGAKTTPFGAAHTYMACKREYPPPSPLGEKNTGDRFFGKISISPYARESNTVLSGFDARDSGFRNICQWNLDTVLQSLVESIPHSLSGIPDSKAQNSGFHGKNIMDSEFH